MIGKENMMRFTKFTISSIFLLCSLVHVASAEDKIDNGAFGESKVTDVKPVKKKEGECLSFEATYSGTLDRKPSAFLDIEKNFTNLLNAFLEVTKIQGTENKYRMALTATTADACPTITDGTNLTISTYSGEDATDSRQTTPDAVTFTSKNNKLTQK